MIYKKEANFPYPILTNSSTSYEDSLFELDVNLEENTSTYRFDINYKLSSSFIENLISLEQASVILIIQSKDNKFFRLNKDQTSVEVKKSRISLSNRTTLQLHIQSNENINFKENKDLVEFYDQFKADLVIPKNTLLGFSNTVTFDGSSQKPFVLFEKKLDETLQSPIKIELGTETIVIHYQKEDYQFSGINNGSVLNNTYIYMGLRTALQRFIYRYSEYDEDYVDLKQMNDPEGDLLDFKLFQLMRKKMIEELSYDSIDHTISLISDKIIEKFSSVVKELEKNGD